MFSKNKQWIFYVLYTAAAGLFFLYVLFPSAAIEAYIVSIARKMQPDVELTIDRVAPVFPPGIRASSVILSEGGIDVAADQIDIIPELRTLFGSDTAYSIRGKGYDGRVTGRMILDRDTALTMLHVDLFDMQIARMAAVKQVTGHQVSGILSGSVNYEKAGAAGLLTGNLVISQAGLTLEIPGLNLKELTFAEVNARLSSDSAAGLRIESLAAKGSQISGEMSGTIHFKTPPAGSELDLAGTVKPHPAFISSLGDAVSIFFQKRSGNNTFPFSIGGTIESPEFLLR